MPIAGFGAIQYKLAEMAIRTYAAESIAWRIAGLIQSQLDGFSWNEPNASNTVMRAVEEYAIECSIVKVFGSEALDYVADEGVQIHGGYGFHQDYYVERAYRDSRINRIFEGTNEINRLLIVSMLLKRAARGQLALMEAIEKLTGELTSAQVTGAAGPDEERLIQNAKKIALLGFGMAYQKFGAELDKHQQVCMRLADIVIETFAMESAWLRQKKFASRGKASIAREICAIFLRDAMGRIELAARDVIGATATADVRMAMQLLRKLAAYDPIDSSELRHTIASKLLVRERYAV
jgi:alkylation response protein AidB-like acyl-CoA dehydrogenase